MTYTTLICQGDCATLVLSWNTFTAQTQVQNPLRTCCHVEATSLVNCRLGGRHDSREVPWMPFISVRKARLSESWVDFGRIDIGHQWLLITSNDYVLTKYFGYIWICNKELGRIEEYQWS